MQKVYVRGFGGGLRRLALLEIADDLAFVCGEEFFEDVSNGERDPPLIGFHLSDVFAADGIDAPMLAADDPRAKQLRPIAR
jgi:hypothetical protein